MTDAEIISRISPAERTQALETFMSIDNMKYPGLSEEDRRLHKETHYTALRDSLVAKANSSVEGDQAAAAPIRQGHRAVGSGGIHTLRSRDLAALQERARALVGNIDTHRSPAASLPRMNQATGEHIVEVRYYGV